jgi:hypothetical protein
MRNIVTDADATDAFGLTEGARLADDIDIEFAINAERQEVAAATDGLQRRGLPELYLLAEGEPARRMLDPDRGRADTMLVARGVLGLASDVAHRGSTAPVRPRRLELLGRSATFALSAVHEPAPGFVSLLVRESPQVCAVVVTDWAGG